MEIRNRLIIAHNRNLFPDILLGENYFHVKFQPGNYEDLYEVISEYEYLISSVNYKIDKNMLIRAGNLKAISTPSTGTDHIDFKTCEELKIKVFSLKNDTEFLSSITATAELAFAHILNVIRNIPSAFDHVKAGGWNPSAFRGRELQGKTLGIIGYGRLGKMMGGYAKAFHMSIIVYDPNVRINIDGIKQVSLNELLRGSDIISLHVHLTKDTTGLINRDSFKKMKKGVIIINTSRGAVIDSEAFLDALLDGTVAGAGLDVLENELLGDISANPFVEYARKNTNLIITPHIGGVAIESQQKAFSRAMEKLVDFDKKAKSALII